MKTDSKVKESLFTMANFKGALVVLCSILLLIFSYLILSSSWVSAEVIEAAPDRIVKPPKNLAVGTAPVVSPITKDTIVPQLTRTTLVVTHPEPEDGTSYRFNTEDQNVDLIIDLFENTGCTVILGEPESLGQKAFIYSVGKTKCTIVQVVKTVTVDELEVGAVGD